MVLLMVLISNQDCAGPLCGIAVQGRGFNLICCSVALASCCSGRMSSQYSTLTRWTSQREGCIAYPNLTALTNNNLSKILEDSGRLKVPDWRLWAYTDGSCLTYKTQQCVGAGVFTKNTINRAELTGIASALRAKCSHIATDSASDTETTLISWISQEAHT